LTGEDIQEMQRITTEYAEKAQYYKNLAKGEANN